MIQDYHVHTAFSFDGKSTVDQYLLAADAMGMDRVCFTEHFNPMGPDGVTDRMLPDMDAYEAAVRTAQARLGCRCQALMGVEIGPYVPAACAMAEEKLNGRTLDFILMGNHWNPGGKEYWISANWQGDTKAQAQRENMLHLLSLIEAMDAFDAVAHLTYFSRGCPYPDKEIRHDDAPEETDAVLRVLVERGKGIEINTSTYRGFGFFMPGLSVLKRYRELGGEIVTLGSDSHHVSTLGSGIQEARELLRAAGFSHYTLFRERVPQFCKL